MYEKVKQKREVVKAIELAIVTGVRGKKWGERRKDKKV